MVAQLKSHDQVIGLVKQADFDTPGTPDIGLSVMSGSSISPQLGATYDDGHRGIAAADFEAIADSGSGQASLEGFAYPLTLGHLLMGIFGVDTKTGAGDPYTHTFTLASAPPYYTLEDRYFAGASGGLQMASSLLTSLMLSWDAGSGALKYAAQYVGAIPTIVTPAVSAVVSEAAWEGYHAVLTWGTSALECLAISGEITLSRESSIIHTGCDIKSPKLITAGPLRVQGSITLAMVDFLVISNYLASVRETLSIKFTKTGSPERSIELILTDAFEGDTPPDPDRGGVGVTAKLGIRGIYNVTDAGPAKAVLLNSRSTAY